MKKIFIILLLIPILVFSGCSKEKKEKEIQNNERIYNSKTYIKDKEIEEEIKKNLDNLSDDEVKEINYDELFKDIEELNNNNKLIYAKKTDNKAQAKYEGNGYYVIEYLGGEIKEYIFYSTKNNKIYNYKKIYPMTNKD